MEEEFENEQQDNLFFGEPEPCNVDWWGA